MATQYTVSKPVQIGNKWSVTATMKKSGRQYTRTADYPNEANNAAVSAAQDDMYGIAPDIARQEYREKIEAAKARRAK